MAFILAFELTTDFLYPIVNYALGNIQQIISLKILQMLSILLVFHEINFCSFSYLRKASLGSYLLLLC